MVEETAEGKQGCAAHSKLLCKMKPAKCHGYMPINIAFCKIDVSIQSHQKIYLPFYE